LLHVNGVTWLFYQHHGHTDFSTIELAFLELLFDRQLLVGLDEAFNEQLTSIESQLLDKFGVDQLADLLADVAKTLWRNKHHRAAQKISKQLTIGMITSNSNLYHYLKKRLLQHRQIATVSMFHSAKDILSTHAADNLSPPDIIILHIEDEKSPTELQRLFQPLKYFPFTTKKLVMGSNTNITTPAISYFKAGAQGYIDQTASHQLWDCAINTIYHQEKQFWQVLQRPVTAYTITDSARILAREIGGIFSR